MKVIGLTEPQLRQRIAVALNCDPQRPDTWPSDVLDFILKELDADAEASMKMLLQTYGHRLAARYTPPT